MQTLISPDKVDHQAELSGSRVAQELPMGLSMVERGLSGVSWLHGLAKVGETQQHVPAGWRQGVHRTQQGSWP